MVTTEITTSMRSYISEHPDLRYIYFGGKGGVERVSFLPAFINARAQPYAVEPGDPKFQEIVEFAEWVSDQHPHRFRVEGNEVVIETNLA